MNRAPFEIVQPRPAHPLTGRPVLVLETARHTSRRFVGQVVTVREAAAPTHDGAEQVLCSDGTTTFVCRVSDLDTAPEERLRTSTAASSQYPRTCPTCGAEPYQPCRSLRSGRVTDTHLRRIND